MTNLVCAECGVVLLVQVWPNNEGYIEITCGRCGKINKFYLARYENDLCIYDGATLIFTGVKKSGCKDKS